MPKFAANLSMLFGEVDFLDRFEAAAKAGFTGVEYMFPYAYGKEQLAEKLKKNGLVQVLFNLPAGNWEKGERGLACLPDRVNDFREGVAKAVEYAAALGCKQVNCQAGLTPQNISPLQAHDTMVSNVRFAAAELKKAGVRLLIEPCNSRDMPGFYLNYTTQALKLIEDIASDNVFVQYDVYHAQVMEGDLANTIEKNLAKIGHIQIADNPGRHEPGTGEINYAFLFPFLDRIGYSGWVGCEYKPAAKTEAGLGWRTAVAGK
jgi:hydroxypyruvate isomerase